MDVPGSDEFVGDLNQALEVVKGAIIMIDASKGVEVGTERVWHEIRKRHIPAILFVNKMDKENVKFEEVLEEIREKLGKKKQYHSLGQLDTTKTLKVLSTL